VWYEIERYDQPHLINADCVYANYSERDATSITIVNNARVIPDGTLLVANSIGVVAFPDLDPLPGRLNVSYHGRKLSLFYSPFQNFVVLT
jgi:lipocalin